MSREKHIGMGVHQATISVAVMDAGCKLMGWAGGSNLRRCRPCHTSRHPGGQQLPVELLARR